MTMIIIILVLTPQSTDPKRKMKTAAKRTFLRPKISLNFPYMGCDFPRHGCRIISVRVFDGDVKNMKTLLEMSQTTECMPKNGNGLS